MLYFQALKSLLLVAGGMFWHRTKVSRAALFLSRSKCRIVLSRVPASNDTEQLSDLQSCRLPAYCCWHSMNASYDIPDAGLLLKRRNVACVTNPKFPFSMKTNSSSWMISGQGSVFFFMTGTLFNKNYRTNIIIVSKKQALASIVMDKEPIRCSCSWKKISNVLSHFLNIPSCSF